MRKLRPNLHMVVLLASLPALSQDTFTRQEVRVKDLQVVSSKSHELRDVLAASLATILHDGNLCCAKDSSLEDRVESADPRSLKDVAAKLSGRQHLSDGTPITVTADFWPASSANSGQIVAALRANHPLLMEWDSHLYVVYGVVFNDAIYGGAESTQEIYVIQKLLLLDLRYSDERRYKVFSRDIDAWDKVQGLMLLEWAPA